MFGVANTLSQLTAALDEYKSHLEKGVELSVSVSAIPADPTKCSATKCMVKQFDSWDEASESWKSTSHTSCAQTDAKTITCYCEKVKIEGSVNFGTFPSDECVFLEVQGGNSSSINDLEGKSAVKSVFLAKDGDFDKTMLIGTSKDELTKELSDASTALASVHRGLLAGAIVGLLVMICLCIGGCFALRKHSQQQKAGSSAGTTGPVVMGSPE